MSVQKSEFRSKEGRSSSQCAGSRVGKWSRLADGCALRGLRDEEWLEGEPVADPTRFVSPCAQVACLLTFLPFQGRSMPRPSTMTASSNLTMRR